VQTSSREFNLSPFYSFGDEMKGQGLHFVPFMHLVEVRHVTWKGNYIQMFQLVVAFWITGGEGAAEGRLTPRDVETGWYVCATNVRYLRGTSSVMERLTVTTTGPAVEVTRRSYSCSSGNRSLRAVALYLARRLHCIDGSDKRREASVGCFFLAPTWQLE
jgi:hypothetical protein